MIITDAKGGKLKLTRTTLTELTGEAMPGDKWTLRLSELTRAGATDGGRTALLMHRIDPAYGELTGALHSKRIQSADWVPLVYHKDVCSHYACSAGPERERNKET